ncbi:MAG: phosphate regulon sensor histidine kinase PhoR [Gammaproteobacteria bacterium]|nr:phosphate regulon sensor histidine kinase PhoR [Gammaproteobacteria bacterium]
MSNGVSRELTWIIASFWVFLVVAWVSKLWVEVLVAYVFFYIGRQLWSAYKFEKWMHGGSRSAFPPSSGYWGEVSYLVSKKQHSLEKRADLQNYKSEQFRAASMALPIAIVSLTEHNQIEWFNESAQSLLVLKQSDVGHKIESLVRHPDFVRYLKSSAYEQPIFMTEFMGMSRTYSCQLLSYHKTHRLLLLEDVHELYNLGKIRKDFVANASHELRTPLTVINGYLEMMTDMPDKVPATWNNPLKQMFQQSQRMQSIIEDLLTLSKIESDTLVNRFKEVKVDRLLSSIEIDTKHLYGDQYNLSFEIQSGLVVSGVEEPLKSVFINLISNAIRYTEIGGDITVRWYSTEQSAVFEVEDTGIGIASEHLSRLTERFYRVDTARSRQTGGTGLGLAIVKHVLDKHHAHLRVMSQVGKGSTFSCRFEEG